MRRVTSLLTALVIALAATAAPAQAMQPPGHGAHDRFGCVAGVDQPVAGHPGAAGLADAAPKVAALTDTTTPTAWNAVENADPIEFGSC